MTQQDIRRVALVAIGTIIRIVLSNISAFLPAAPWVDVFIQLGIDVPKAIRDELKRQSILRDFNEADLEVAVRSLSVDEVKHLIEQELATSNGRNATRNLTQQQLINFKQRLLSLQSEFDDILSDIAVRSRIKLKQLTNQKRREADEHYQKLYKNLSIALNRREVQDAYDLALVMLKLRPFDLKIANVETHLYQVLWNEEKRPEKKFLMIVCRSFFVYSLFLLFLAWLTGGFFTVICVTVSFLTLAVSLVIVGWHKYPYYLRWILKNSLIGVAILGGVIVLMMFL